MLSMRVSAYFEVMPTQQNDGPHNSTTTQQCNAMPREHDSVISMRVRIL